MTPNVHELTERIKRLDREIERQSMHVNGLDLAGGSPEITQAYLQTLHRLRADYVSRLEEARSAGLDQKSRKAARPAAAPILNTATDSVTIESGRLMSMQRAQPEPTQQGGHEEEKRGA